MLMKFAFVGALAAFSSAAIPPATARGGGNYDNSYSLPGKNCPMVKCAAPGYCPVALETPTVNGCPMCPRCPCKCGETCQLNGGASGICQETGECSADKRMPQCPNPCAAILCGPNTRCENGKCVPIPTGCETVRCNAETVCVNGRCVPRPGGEKCKCGETCTMYGGGQGVCQVNGECAQNILPPRCPTSGCAAILCAPDKICVDGKCVDNTRGCETVRCTATTHCVLGQCVPNNPSYPCKCGESCTMSTGSLGVCQVNGECAQNIQPPQCNDACKCGDSCTMPYGGLGTCQVNGQCAVNIQKPNCPYEDGPRLCAMDVQTCLDGSVVSRKPPSCAFEPCPVKGCTREVYTCPDGTPVGREGPNCAFKPCPKDSCPCGNSCTTAQNANGFCQRNGQCKKKYPVCR